MTILLLPHHKRDSSGHSFSVVNLSDDVISSDVSSSSVSHRLPRKMSLVNASHASSVSPPPSHPRLLPRS
uniref:Uncharacterized protein n=1 Tax=Brassica oleracea TaxID=3712 RepID=A0A3P6DQJ9_BRAOL|nr:unnamed protein product [Brassica oleracea]